MNTKTEKIFLYVLLIRFTYTFYIYVYMYIYMYTLLYTFYLYVIVRENVYVAFWFCFEFRAPSLQWRPWTFVPFLAKKFLAPKNLVKLEVKSCSSEYIKKVSFDELLRDWFSAYSDFKFRPKKILIKTNICEVRIWRRANICSGDVFQLSHDTSKG